MITYKGKRTNGGIGPQIVLRNERPLSPKASLKLYPHSPDGFNWGYGGSGPAQLALALLYNATHDKILAVHIWGAFKLDHVSRGGDSGHISD